MIERRSAAAARWAVRCSSFAFVLFVVAGLGHRFGLVDTLAFFWLLGLIGGLAIVGLSLAAAGFQRLWEFGERAGRQSMFAAAAAALVLAPYGVSLWRVAALPALADISTDTVDPPAFRPGLRDGLPFANRIEDISAAKAERMIAGYPSVTGRRYEAPLERVVEPVLRLVAERGWSFPDAPLNPFAGADISVEALAASTFLGFPADVVIRVTDEGQSTYVDMRSASRYANHDLGDNARRIVSFLDDLDDVIAAEAGGIAD